MRKIILLILIFAQILNIQAQNLLNNADAASLGRSNTGLNSVTVFSVFHNPAAMSYLQRPSIGIAARNNYLLKELNQSAMAIVIPSKFGYLGASLNYSGFSLYKEYSFGLAYALRIAEKLAIASKIEYLQINQNEYYGNARVIYGELSIAGEITDKLKLGAKLFNPTAAKLNDITKTSLPISEEIGISYTFSPEFNLIIEQKSDFDYNILKFAGEYQFKQLFTIRAGTQINNQLIAFNAGGGFNFKRLIMDIGFEFNQLSTNNYFHSALSVSYVF